MRAVWVKSRLAARFSVLIISMSSPVAAGRATAVPVGRPFLSSASSLSSQLRSAAMPCWVWVATGGTAASRGCWITWGGCLSCSSSDWNGSIAA